MIRLTILNVLAFAATQATCAAPVLPSSGRILVLNNTDYTTASEADSIGCIGVTGALTLNDCAVFSRLKTTASSGISTSLGNCTFTDKTQPEETDSAYGRGSYAFHCAQNLPVPIQNEFYTIDGFEHPFICHSDVNCLYDIKPVDGNVEGALAWEYRWGSGQVDVPTGHLKTLWLWDAADN